jgi:WD40 repeat protein
MFLSDSRHAVFSATDNRARLYDVLTGKEHSSYTGHAGPVTCAAVSPDGTLLLTGSAADKTVRLHELEAGADVFGETAAGTV